MTEFSQRRWMRARLLGTAMLGLPGVAFAQTPPPVAAPPAVTPGGGDTAEAEEDIVVTGRVPPGAVVGDIPPQNQLNPGQIAAYGVGTVSELLDQIAEQTQSAQGRDASSGPLVLVNGKRISGVNEVADLPTEAILRVDILPEEVAIKYGYDAQRKVVNIILKRRVQSTVLNAGGGLATEGQGESANGDVTITRIRDNKRLNLAARAQASADLLESERGIVPARGEGVVDPTGAIANDAGFRTLRPSTRTYSLNGTLARDLSDKVNASFNARGSYATSDALRGLATGTLAVPAGNPFGAGGSLDRFIGTGALDQRIETATARAGVALNADLSTRWKLSATGSYDHSDVRTGSDRGYDLAGVQAAIDAGDPLVNPYGTLPAGVLGPLLRQRATALTDTAEASALVTGSLFKLPAGTVQTSLRIGADYSALDSTATFRGIETGDKATRSNLIARGSLDLPIASRRNGVLSAIGNLTANVNGAVTRVSDYGTLGTYGYGLNWTPRAGLNVIASVNQDRVAPTLNQLNAPAITNEGVRVFDFTTGTTALVTQLTGGNAGLRADDRRVFKLGLNVKPLTKLDLTLTANYLDSRTRNPVGSLASATALTQAAFPDRFIRDADGVLVQVDSRSINFARIDREEMRWGITFNQVLRAPKRPQRPAGGWPGERARGGAAGGAVAGGPAAAAPRQRDPAQAGQPAPEGQDILVEGRRPEENAPPPPGLGGPDGDRGPRDGFGPPPGEFSGPPGGGPGGPGGGFGPGGPGGRGRGFSGGSDNGMRLQFSAFHSWFLRNRVLLREGGPSIDLLDGGTLGGAGQPQHEVQFNTGLIDNGIGLRLSGRWQSATRIDAAGGSSAGDLRFSPLATFDLRVFANLQNRFPGQAWARGTRVSFSLSNVFNERQRVRDAAGATPLIYQPAYLDPLGRAVNLTVRRIF